MTVDAGQSKILAKLQSRSKGAYDKVKGAEAQAGGRSLPGGIEGGVAVCTDAKLGETEKAGDPFFFIYSSVTEPSEYNGIFNGMFYGLTEDQWATYDEKLGRLISDLKLMGFGDIVENASSEGDMLVQVIEHIKTNKPAFIFNTGKRARKNGDYSVFIQGCPEGDYVPPSEDSAKQAVKGAAKGKKPVPKAKAKPSTNGSTPAAPTPFSKGDKVTTINDYFEDGEVYAGTVVSVDKKAESAMVEFDDGTGQSEVPFVSLAAIAEENATTSIEVDDRVISTNDHFGDGVDYEGTVTGVEGDTATVVFDDDGEEQDLPLTNVKPLT